MADKVPEDLHKPWIDEIKIKCKCGAEKVVFSSATMKVDCDQCSEVLAEPTGGKVHVLGKIVQELD
ncbi:30S ribosomal protein S27e [Candidatus Micrarchaeota archaeon]|nr:30S ribosomal protein S27e [Candidatus Micrarchaeota archaeon]